MLAKVEWMQWLDFELDVSLAQVLTMMEFWPGLKTMPIIYAWHWIKRLVCNVHRFLMGLAIWDWPAGTHAFAIFDSSGVVGM